MTVTRYLVVKIEIDMDFSKTDQKPDDHIEEVVDYVSSELEYDIQFSGMVEAGSDASDAIEIPVKIIDSQIVGLLESDPS